MTNQESVRGEPLISVITICRNSRDCIKQTLQSVLAQEFDDFEYVVVDGASNDGTQTEVARILQAHPRVPSKVVSERDSGISDAMNKGVRLSRGRLIVHLHAGDYFIDSSVLRRVADSWRATHWRWGVAGSIVVDSSGRHLHRYRPHSDPRHLLAKNSIPHQSTFLDRGIFEKHGFFDVQLSQAMDYEYWLRIVFKGGERYEVLPFDCTYYLAGGRSANIKALLKGLYRLRKKQREYGGRTNCLQDALFLGRVWLFWLWQATKLRLPFKRRN